MSNLKIVIKKASDEACENRKKAIHNFFCKNADDLQPYDNKEYLNMVSVVKSLLRTRSEL